MSWFDKPVERFFSTTEEREIVASIKKAESLSSGEIRVHLENHCEQENVQDRAWQLFHELEMGETQARNGVLIYLAVKDHCFAIIGDEGIYEKQAHTFWEEIAQRMEKSFKEGEFSSGIITAIETLGKELSIYFPPGDKNPNELTDEISFGDLED